MLAEKRLLQLKLRFRSSGVRYEAPAPAQVAMVEISIPERDQTETDFYGALGRV